MAKRQKQSLEDKLLTDLQRKIAQHQQEPVLVVLEEYHKQKRACFPGVPKLKSWTQYIAIIDRKPEFKSREMIILSTGYLTRESSGLRNDLPKDSSEIEWEKERGDLGLERSIIYTDGNNARRTIAIGRTEVELFFSSETIFRQYRNDAKPTEGKAKELLRWRLGLAQGKDVDPRYFEAMKLLNAQPSEMMMKYRGK